MRSKLALFFTTIILIGSIFSVNAYSMDFFDNDYEHHFDADNIAVKDAIINNPINDGVTEYNDITQVFITTENTEAPNRESYINASISIKADNRTGEAEGIDYTTGKIKIRGNSTGGLDKKPYNIKFDSKVEILGFSKGKKYCLLANRYDKSFLRNYLAYMLSKECELEYTPSFRFVDLWLNNKYMGNYLITTPIETGKNRLDINVDGNDALLERESARVEEGVTYVTSPKLNVRLAVNEPEEPTEDQIDNINEVLANVDDMVLESTENDLDDIAEVLDIDSFIDFYIIEEFFKNRDVDFSSTRFYIKDDILYASPCWDFDLSSGNFPEESLAPYTNFYALNSPWIKNLMKNSEFKQKFINRYNEIQYKIQKIIYYYLENIDYIYRDSFKRDKDVAGWDYKPQGLDRNPEPTHKGNVKFLKQWLVGRNNWLINEFAIEGVIDYSKFYDSLYKVEILSNKYDDIKNDAEVQEILNKDIDNSYSKEDIDSFTNILMNAISKYPDEVYEDVNDEIDTPVVESETETIDILDNYSVTYYKNKTYNGKKNNKAEDYGIIVTDKNTGKTYSNDDVLIKVKGGKNVGKSTISIRSIKSIKNSKKLFKNSKTFDITITPLKVFGVVSDKESYENDGNILLSLDGYKIKSIHVLVRDNSKIRSIRTKSYKIENNSVIFTKNFTGKLTIIYNFE